MIRLALTFVLVLLALPNIASAQLFGERTLGRPLTRGAKASAATAGTVTTGRRFSRNSRGRSAFVGTDRNETRTFVGARQGRTQGNVNTAAATLREQPRRVVNRPRPAPKQSGIYEPRLQPAFTVPKPVGSEQAVQVQRRIGTVVDSDRLTDFVVLVEGRTAILSGFAASSRDRELAELIASFEPGISEVRNQLVVQTAPPAADLDR